MPRRTWVGRVYKGRDENGKQDFYWCGRYPTKRERDAAVAEAKRTRPWEKKPVDQLTCGEWVDRYLNRYERLVQQKERKWSSLDTARYQLGIFRKTFGKVPLAKVTPIDAEDWAQTVSPPVVPAAVALFNYAKRMRVVDHNPFEGLGKIGKGRSEQNPPTVEELERIRDACMVLGSEFGPRMRDFIDFAALTLMRPSELYELRFSDVDLRLNRITKARRLYRRTVDTPKSGVKTIALPPPARMILLRQPTRTRDDGLVFVTRTGRRLSAGSMSQYWIRVRTQAGLDASFDLYRCSKHLGVHRLYALGLSARAIAAQAGWSERAVEGLLRVYGHRDLVALAEVDALYAADEQKTEHDVGYRQ